jgi:hypothetical protein
MAYDEHLAARIRKALAGMPGITEKRMFGGVAFLRHGLMLAGVSGHSLMARVGKPNHADSLALEHVREMDFTGKPMAGYVFVDEPGLATDEALQFWLRRCAALSIVVSNSLGFDLSRSCGGLMCLDTRQ